MLIWLEDRESTIMPQLRYLEKLGIEYQVLPSIESFLFFLEELDEATTERSVFILDIMIHGINDLTRLGIEGADTLGGATAGYVFADRHLRKDQSRWISVPLAFYTEQSPTDFEVHIQALRDRCEAQVNIFQKEDDVHFGKFKEFVAQHFGGG